MSARKTLLLVAVLASSIALPGCRSMSSQGQGALIGGLLGAGAGHAIGHHRGNRTNHALAGAAAGALAGYVIGDLVEDHRRENAAGPETIDGTDNYRRSGRRVYYGDEPEVCDPRW